MPKYTVELKGMASGDSEKLVMMPAEQEATGIHDHHFFELVYITGGTAVQILNGVESRLSKGDYFIMDYGSIHEYVDCENFELLNCLFLPEIIDETLKGCHSFEALIQGCLIRYYTPALRHTPVNCVFPDKDGRIWQLLSGMLEEYQGRKQGYTEIFRCRLIEILILTLRRLLRTGIRTPKSEVVGSAVQYMDRYYGRHNILSQFCADYHYSPQYVSRKFREETGITFLEYVQKVRIEKSCEMLKGTNLRIAEISQRVGYEDTKFFQKIFKKYLAVSPGDYRKMAARF